MLFAHISKQETMKKSDKGPLTPKGVLTFQPEAAARKRWIEEQTLAVFGRWGYREIVPPPFEYLDLLSAGTHEDILKKSYRITERSTGRMMVLRPDVTPQVARIVSTTMADQPKPMRLCYSQSVFRYESEHGGRQREIIQLGAELIGLDEPEADAEVIALCIEVLKAAGVEKFQIALGQVEFYRGILNASGISGTLADDIQKAVCKKNFSRLVELLAGVEIDEAQREAILGACNLFGGPEVLEKAATYAGNEESKKALGNLSEIWRMLAAYGLEEHVIIDLGEVRGFDYHTGVIFEIFAEGMGSHLGSGGRYNNLLGKFGTPSAATGFALDLERVMNALETQKRLPETKGTDILVIDYQADKREAFQLCGKLREAGYSVARDIVKRSVEESMKYARKNRCRFVVILGRSDLPKGTVALVDLKDGGEQAIPAEKLLGALRR